VAEAAFHLIATEGEQALTMRRLGEVLGVKAMALYNHYPDKEAILDAVAGLALSRIPLPPAKGPWKSRIKALCHSIRDMARQFPSVFRVAMFRPSPPTSALPEVELALSALGDAGLSPAAQAVAYQTIRLYVRAFCLWEIEELRSPRAAMIDVSRLKSTYPHIAAAVNPLFSPDPDRLFDAGLDLLLRGLQPSKDR
jgi:AcrR family transcriptional regulator